MPDRERLIAECRARAAALSQREGWGLGPDEAAAYAAQLVALVPAHSLDRQLEQVVRSYHADHARVADLRDPARPGHAAAWAWAAQEIARVAQLKGLSWSRDPIVDLGDLVQTVQAEVVRSLPDYRFESRLGTWLHGVTVRRLRRLHRDNGAAKRAVRPEPIEAAYERPAERGQGERLLASALAAEIRRALAVTGDERYARIFLMRVAGDMSNEEIAAQLHLHPSRVRALLKTARDLLRSDPALRAWNGDGPAENAQTQ